MSSASNTLVHHRTEFDDWRSLTIGIYMALVGYAVMVGMPVISTSWVNNLGFSEVEVGRVAGADLGGLAIGAVLAALTVARVDRRYLAAGATLFTIAANVLCIFYQSYDATLWLRLAAGTGSGLFTGIAVATIGGHSRPAFAFGLELFAFAGSQGLELWLLPYLSIEGLYLTLVGTYVIGLLFISWLPRRPVEKSMNVEVDVEEDSGEHHVEQKHVPVYVPWMVLLAIVFTYINIGAYWTYVELATVGSEASPEWVANILWATSVFSDRLDDSGYGLARPLLDRAPLSLLVIGPTLQSCMAGYSSIYTRPPPSRTSRAVPAMMPHRASAFPRAEHGGFGARPATTVYLSCVRAHPLRRCWSTCTCT